MFSRICLALPKQHMGRLQKQSYRSVSYKACHQYAMSLLWYDKICNVIVSRQLIEALSINPLGYVIAFIMTIGPAWIIIDVVLQKDSLYKVYQRMEALFKRPIVFVLFSISIVINWAWNILKGL